jgi:hypothetical protein
MLAAHRLFSIECGKNNFVLFRLLLIGAGSGEQLVVLLYQEFYVWGVAKLGIGDV